MINFKRVILVVVVIALLAIAGVFIALRLHNNGEGVATGAAIQVPSNESNTTKELATETPAESNISPTALEAITEGLSADKVIELLGEPTDKQIITTAKGNVIVYWYYTDSSKQVWQIGISGGAVSVVRKF